MSSEPRQGARRGGLVPLAASSPELSFVQLDLADPEDFEQLVKRISVLYTELFGADAVPSPEVFERLRQGALGEGVAAWRDDAAHWAFVGRDANGEVLAFVTLAESFAVFAHGYYGIINELWVHPQHRGRGLGEQVIQHCAEVGRSRCWERMDVTAPPMAQWDRTFAFYEKRGFVWTGRKLKYFIA